MKNLKLWLMILLATMLVTKNANAQVLIGDDTDPEKGAVLDLKKATASTTGYIGGLLLPNIVIEDLEWIPATFTDAGVITDRDNVSNLAGLVAYNTVANGDKNIAVGYYLWDGKKWNLISIDGGSMTIQPQKPAPVCAAGTGEDDSCLTSEEITVTDPGCTMPGNYSYMIIAGMDYATVSPEASDNGKFSVTFQPNNTAFERKAVVMVTNPCGKNGTFIFSQLGAVCPGTHNDPTLNATSGIICAGGAFYLWVTNAQDGATYLWTRNNIIVHTGSSFHTGEAGTYKVYTDIVGCGTAATVTLTADKNNTAEQPVTISASNNGVICSGGNVILTANKVPSGASARWFLDGVEKTGLSSAGTNAVYVTQTGTWFAAVASTPNSTSCSSAPSNSITVTSSEATPLAAPVFTINGKPIASAVICKGGLLELTVATDYSATPGVTYQWYIDGAAIPTLKSQTSYYTVPANATNMTVSVTVSKAGSCSSSASSGDQSLTLTAPAETNINGGQTTYICGSDPVVLSAGVSGASEYTWFKVTNGVDVKVATTAGNYTTSDEGEYKVAYQSANGCVSKISTAVSVVRSNFISLTWGQLPAQILLGQTYTLAVNANPETNDIVWVANTAGVNIIPLVKKNEANVTFPNAAGAVSITVKATNGCGTAELTKTDFSVVNGCQPASVLNLTSDKGASVKVGSSVKFTATGNGTLSSENYEWFVGGVSKQSSNANTYNFTPSVAGTYTIKVKFTSTCDAGKEASYTLTVTPDPNVPDADAAKFKLTGTTCFDVWVQERLATDACMLLNTRRNTFLDASNNPLYVFNYEFIATAGTYSNLVFTREDGSALTAGDMTTNGTTGTLSFLADDADLNNAPATGVREKAKGTDISSAKTVIVYAIFTDLTDGNTTKRVKLELTIKDCVCGCPVKVGTNDWLVMKCHNLGADETSDWKDPVTNGKKLIGEYYQWGRKAAVATVETPAAAIGGWTASPSYNQHQPAFYNSGSDAVKTGVVKTTNDPCPDGWRMPTRAEWVAIMTTTNNTQSRTGSWTNSETNYRTGLLLTPVGSSSATIYLPAAGYRGPSNGALSYRGSGGCYWSSTQVSNTGGYHLYFYSSSVDPQLYNSKSNGYSIRCVVE